MKLAVVQHEVCASQHTDLESIVSEVETACARGADMVICPQIPSIAAGGAISEELLSRLRACGEHVEFIPFEWTGPHESVLLRRTAVGATAVLLGDECIDRGVTLALSAAHPDAVIMRPNTESILQAEAFIEWALAWSVSISGLVVICEPVGAVGERDAFGGSCVIASGELAAEAGEGAEILIAELEAPVPLPEPPEPLPAVPPLLQQRWAYHHGEKVPVGYLADLS